MKKLKPLNNLLAQSCEPLTGEEMTALTEILNHFLNYSSVIEHHISQEKQCNEWEGPWAIEQHQELTLKANDLLPVLEQKNLPGKAHAIFEYLKAEYNQFNPAHIMKALRLLINSQKK